MRLNWKAFPLVVEGIPYLIPPAVITVIGGLWGKGYLFFPFLALTIFVCSFFRNPPRSIPDGEGLILSPADGRIVGIEKGAETTKVSIFMSVFNCHVNRAPAAGTIEEVRYQRGRFLPANKGEASRQNEQNTLQLQSAEGLKVLFTQVAGIVARRIVCYVRRGDEVQRGEIFGAILFGSRVDIYLPHGVKVRVREGERVRGGESVLGVIT
ncbi:MAG: phosphatidylserine decarboxylase [Deltaproteobacteria bacterium RBG_13_52_11]|nr:MAG: phosphatidylserine decarboxylase [Deltaproteobacteria bacterium RBG_13_52_11]